MISQLYPLSMYYLYTRKKDMEQLKQNTILKRFINGIYSRKDADRIIELFRSQQHTKEVDEEMDHVWQSAQAEKTTYLQHERYTAEARMLLNRICKEEKKFSFVSLLKYAAILVLVFSVGLGVYQFSQVADLQNMTYTEIRVKNGEHKQVILPDGTKVILNAGSFMKYPERFAEDFRQIEMDGEAFFEVVHDEDKPFIVSTKDASVKVLGTSFNVKAYDADEQILVSVRSGKVQVDMTDAMMRLLPDEQLVFSRKNGEIQKRNESARHATVWIDGGLYFNKTPIRSVAKELERMYNCKIEFSGNVPYDNYIYGEHDNKSLESVLKSIQYSTDIKYRKEDDKIIFYK